MYQGFYYIRAFFHFQIPDNLPNGYPTRNLKPRPFVLEGNILFVTAYFMEPCKTYYYYYMLAKYTVEYRI